MLNNKRINTLIPIWVILLGLIMVVVSSCGKGSDHHNDDDIPQEDTTETEELVIKVMSYNIHRGNPPSQQANVIDLQATADVIKAQRPDLVSLNEVDVHTKRSGIKLNEAKELGRLTGMHAYFAKAMDYDEGQYGDAVLSRYPIVDSMRYELPFAVAGSEPRDIAMIKIEVKGEVLLFASTHLDHLASEENRILQANTIVNQILPRLKHPLIIGGDLNARPESETIRTMGKKLTMGCMGGGCPLTFPYDKPDRSIDYIMVTPGEKFEFKSYTAISGMLASDHLPLVAEIVVKK